MEKKLKVSLYLDDQRIPTTTISGYEPWDVVRNFTEFTEYITKNGVPDLISFDHDLADEHILDFCSQLAFSSLPSPNYDTYREKTGLDCARWLCETYVFNMQTPELKLCTVHSANPAGAANIISYINGFKKHMGWEPNCFVMVHPFTEKINN